MSENAKTANQIIRAMVVEPTVADIWEITAHAMEKKRKEFQELGYDLNHNINEGDVRCVLKAIVSAALQRSENQ